MAQKSALWTITGPAMRGRMCRRRMAPVRRPLRRAAFTYNSARMARVAPRVIRNRLGQLNTPRVIMAA
jgi:hypothetical protein